MKPRSPNFKGFARRAPAAVGALLALASVAASGDVEARGAWASAGTDSEAGIYRMQDILGGGFVVGDSLAAPYDVQAGFLAASRNPPPDGNHPPVPQPDTAGVNSDTLLVILAARMLLNDHDPDGDTLTMVGVSPQSAMGGTVTLNSGLVTYQPPPGYVGFDSFSYTVRDVIGAVGMTFVTVEVGDSNAGGLNIVRMQTLPDGNVVILFVGIPGRNYDIQASPTLHPADWQRIVSVTAGSHGLFEFEDTQAGQYPSRFYRLAKP